MGISSFVKLFPSNKEIKLKDLKGKRIVIDAMSEIYRCSLGISKMNQLTDSDGNSTIHINGILLGVILKLKSFGIEQYWVFDNKFIKNKNQQDPLKSVALKQREKKRREEKQKLKKLREEVELLEKDELFSSSEDESDSVSKKTQGKNKSYKKKLSKHEKILKCKKDIERREKRCFKIQEYHIKDVQFMLDCFNITWCVAPYRLNNEYKDPYESEHVCAMLTQENKYGLDVLMDYVLSPDADTLLFGAKKTIKRQREKGKKNKFYEYDLGKILNENNLTQDDLIKIGLILGSDFAMKTKGIGIKSIFKKIPKTKLKNKEFLETLTEEQKDNINDLKMYEIIKLSKEQQIAFDEIFTKTMTPEEIDSIEWKNLDEEPFNSAEGVQNLLDWLELVKGFNRKRIIKSISKLNLTFSKNIK